MKVEASQDLTFLDLTFMRQFKGQIRGRSGPMIYVHSPGSPTPVGGCVEAVVVRGPLRGVVRATVLEHERSELSMWVTACELSGFKARDVRHRIDAPCEVGLTGGEKPGVLLDLSSSGACIETSAELDPGDLLSVVFTLGKERVKGSFWVVWSERGVGKPITRYGLRLNEELKVSANDWKSAVAKIARRAA